MNRWLILFCAYLLFAGMLMGEDISTVEKLAAECAAGNHEACKTLADIAKNRKLLLDVRKAAIERLTDQSVLTDIAIAENDKFSLVREFAVEKLQDQTVLIDIAKNDESSWIRETAVGMLQDQAVLTGIAKDDKDIVVRMTAVGRLTDQTLLAEIAYNDKDIYIRKAALQALIKAPKPISAEAIAWLKRTKKGGQSDWERNARKALIQGILEDQWPVVVAEPGVIVSDEGLLPPGRYTFSASYSSTGGAINYSSKENVSFSGILKPDGIYWIHSGAYNISEVWNPWIELICNGQGCASIAKTHDNDKVRMAAVEKIANLVLLADIAKNDESETVRGVAESRLKELQGK